MQEIKSDLSQLTGISVSTLEKLTNKIIALISHYTYEDLHKGNCITEIDIGIGTLYIELSESNVRYKFVPTKKLISSVKKSLTEDSNDLMSLVEKTLTKRVEDTYKELL